MPAGRTGRRWHRLKTQVYSHHAPCCRCGQPINYTLPYLNPLTGRPDPNSKSVDHYPHPLSTHPHLAEDPTNLAAAHLGCNWHAGAGGPLAVVAGTTSENW